MSKYSCKGEVAAKCPFYIRESLLSITCVLPYMQLPLLTARGIYDRARDRCPECSLSGYVYRGRIPPSWIIGTHKIVRILEMEMK